MRFWTPFFSIFFPPPALFLFSLSRPESNRLDLKELRIENQVNIISNTSLNGIILNTRLEHGGLRRSDSGACICSVVEKRSKKRVPHLFVSFDGSGSSPQGPDDAINEEQPKIMRREQIRTKSTTNTQTKQIDFGYT